MEQESSEKPSKLLKIKKITKEPWCIAAILFLGYIAQAAIDKYLLEGKPVKEVLSWMWETTLAFPEKPLVQILMIPMAIWMFYQGVQKLEKAEKFGALEDQRKWAEETETRREIARIPNQMAKCYALRIDIERLNIGIDNHEIRCEKYGLRLDNLDGDGELYFDYLSVPNSSSHEILEDHIEQLDFFSFSPPDWNPAWKNTDSTLGKDADSDRCTFRKDDNIAYLEAQRCNLNLATARIKVLREFSKKQEAELKKLENSWMEMANE